MAEYASEQVTNEVVVVDHSDRNWRRFVTLIVTIILIALIWWLITHIAQVPRVIGMQAPEAKAVVNAARFPAQFINLPKNRRLAGKVVLQVPSQGWRFTWMPVRMVVDPAAGLSGASVSLADDPPSDLPPMTPAEPYREVMPYDPEEVQPLYNVPRAAWGARMPNVQTMDEDDAKVLLRGLGMTVRVRRGPSTVDVPEGLVFYQKPAPGSKVKRNGQKVLLWISEGPLNIGAPDYDPTPYPRPDH